MLDGAVDVVVHDLVLEPELEVRLDGCGDGGVDVRVRLGLNVSGMIMLSNMYVMCGRL